MQGIMNHVYPSYLSMPCCFMPCWWSQVTTLLNSRHWKLESRLIDH